MCAFLFAAPPAIAQLAKADRIVVEYSTPTHPALKQVYELVKKTRALEQVREILLPVQWPRALKLELKNCGGEANAGYENAVITVCYELLDDFWRSAKAGRPSVITREDASANR